MPVACWCSLPHDQSAEKGMAKVLVEFGPRECALMWDFEARYQPTFTLHPNSFQCCSYSKEHSIHSCCDGCECGMAIDYIVLGICLSIQLYAMQIDILLRNQRNRKCKNCLQKSCLLLLNKHESCFVTFRSKRKIYFFPDHSSFL